MKQILVVDDNMVSLKQVAAQLAGTYGFSLVKSGAEALTLCDREKPDMILLDVNMPGLDGFETIARLKGNADTAAIPVIFLTGDNDTSTEIRALESGAVDFILKPVDKSILYHRIELHLQMREYQTNLENMKQDLENSIVLSFADLIESKDSNTGGHVLRTKAHVARLGKEMLKRGVFRGELTEESLALMTQAAPFHDIGKIGVSDVILLKPGPLTPEEYDVVKQHTLIGARVLARIAERAPSQYYLEYATLMAEGHHERYDGKGYPNGLQGKDIPLPCRILAVANVFDACMTDRIYRKALSRSEACEVILQGRGTEFDAEVVDVFEAVFITPGTEPKSSGAENSRNGISADREGGASDK
jgi:putative two-component system response regulator